jgi:predicted ArsR family transcriptional regulator
MAPTRKWVEERDARLIALHRASRPYAEIGRELGISTNAAAGRIATLIRRGVLTARQGKWTKVAEHPDWLERAPEHNEG